MIEKHLTELVVLSFVFIGFQLDTKQLDYIIYYYYYYTPVNNYHLET